MNKNNNIEIKKYPKSRKNFQCLGPCYYPGVHAIHPTNLEYFNDDEHSVCPVNEWIEDDGSGDPKKYITDICFNPTEKKSVSSRELELNILTPQINFSPEQFLKIYYQIYSFEESLDYINRNSSIPFGTKSRIINSSLKAFGEKIDLFDMRLSLFFIEYVKNKGIKYLYDNLNKLIDVDKNKIYFVKETKLKENEFKKERINYILETFFDKDEITKFISRFFKHKKQEWDSINNYLNRMIVDLSDYLANKIYISL